MIMQNRDENRIKKEFKARQNRQIVAITAAIFMVMLGAVLYKRPDILGAFSKSTLFGLQAICIAAFFAYTIHNWRCPACNKHLSSDIHRRRCGKCGAQLQ
jgi:hypothetical protein